MEDRSERRWIIAVALGVTLLTFLPYLFDWSLQGASPLYGWYSWYAFNVTDNCVYLSWMRQYADGAWFHRNLFTTLPQSGRQINLLFLLLGKLGGWTGIPLIGLYHAARACACIAVILLVGRLCSVLGLSRRARRMAVVTVALSAGLGWVPGLWERSFAGPVDIWQPEAVTFLSLFIFPLFGVSLALMLGVVINLLEAERRRSLRHAAYAGACAFVLGNIHTYDIITLAVVWLAYLAVALACGRAKGFEGIQPRRDTIGRLLVAGLPPAVSAGHMFWVYRTESVFAQRVAVPTLSPSILWVLLGYGLLIPLAIAGVAIAGRKRPSEEQSITRQGAIFLTVWMVANVLVAYVPLSFQRKLLMGAHIPIAILAGVGLAFLTDKLARRVRMSVVAVSLIILALTNVRFVLRDRGGLRHGGETVRAFMLPGERASADWIRHNTTRRTVVQPLPWLAVAPDGRTGFIDTTVACFVPGLTGRPVDAGHWGETPDFGSQMGKWLRFLMPNTPDAWRRDLLRETGVRYIVFSQKRQQTRDAAVEAVLDTSPVPYRVPYLRRVESACNEDADMFEVVLP